MGGIKKNKKILFQLAAIILPLFILMTAAIVWTVSQSILSGYLESEKKHMREMMSEPYSYFPFLEEGISPRVQEWFLSQPEQEIIDYSNDLNEEEFIRLNDYGDETAGEYEYEWYVNMPEEIRRLYLRWYFYHVKVLIRNNVRNANVDRVFLMDLKEGFQGLVFFDYRVTGESRKTGESFDFDLSEHPVIRELMDSRSEEMVFERSADFPDEGYSYIGYHPILIDGKVRAVIGITYRWDDFRDTLTGTVRKALIVTFSGVAVVLLVLLFFLYRKVIRPVSRMQKAVLAYTGDKDSAKIVERLGQSPLRNELGYLSDAIADLALEIDQYTKENIRIAGERERAEKERFEAEVQVMVSQIRPHFVYNTLSSIAILCDIDPKTAKEAAITFAKYLRANMDALKQKAPVPFEIELEHLKNYLYIEKLRFADALNVEYDIQTTDFELPILSIQPLVENAVKHGVGMKKYGGTVKIATKETDTAYEVVVSDDGVGFEPEEARIKQEMKSDGKSHVGMENTRKRLKDMCGADVVIESRTGEGTTVRVIIPKGETGNKPKDDPVKNPMNNPLEKKKENIP